MTWFIRVSLFPSVLLLYTCINFIVVCRFLMFISLFIFEFLILFIFDPRLSSEIIRSFLSLSFSVSWIDFFHYRLLKGLNFFFSVPICLSPSSYLWSSYFKFQWVLLCVILVYQLFVPPLKFSLFFFVLKNTCSVGVHLIVS